MHHASSNLILLALFAATTVSCVSPRASQRRAPDRTAIVCVCGHHSDSENLQLSDGSWVEYEGRKLTSAWIAKPDSALRTTCLRSLVILGGCSTLSDGHWKEKLSNALAWLRTQKNDQQRFELRVDPGWCTDHALATYTLCEMAQLSVDPVLAREVEGPARCLLDQLEQNPAVISPELLFWSQAIIDSMRIFDASEDEGIKMPNAQLAQVRRGLVTTVARLAESLAHERAQLKSSSISEADRAFALYADLRRRQRREERITSSSDFAAELRAVVARRAGLDEFDPIAVAVYTMTIYQVGGRAWKEWAKLLTEHVVRTQQTDSGPEKTTWRSPHDGIGPMQTTAWNTLTLECYYRWCNLSLID